MNVSTRKRRKRNWKAGVLVLLLSLVVLLAGYTFLFLKYDADAIDLSAQLLPVSLDHPFGTDHLGRDVLTRIMLGAQLTAGSALMALLAAIAIGLPIGLVAGYKGGFVDRLMMRIADMFLAFPDTIVAIVLSGLLGPGIENLLLAIVFVKWVNYARLVRSTVISERQKEYIAMAKINGLGDGQIIRKHLFPHIIGHVLVLASLDLGKIILLISSLSYIGLGAQPPTPEWGAMLVPPIVYFLISYVFPIFQESELIRWFVP